MHTLTAPGRLRMLTPDGARGRTGTHSQGEGECALRGLVGPDHLPCRVTFLARSLSLPGPGSVQRPTNCGRQRSAYARAVSALLWWLIPIGATILAVAWAMYRARPERPTEAIEGMEHLRRMQLAMERPLPQEEPGKARRRLSRGRRVESEVDLDANSAEGPAA